MKCLIKTLRENNMKVTPQRIAIFEMLAQTKSHPSAELIYKKLSVDYPTMSLATVYKSLDIFKKSGLVQELNVGENSFRYDANTKSHPHIICTTCHQVEDIHDAVFTDLISIISKNTNYDVTKQQLYFYGICPQCKSDISQAQFAH
ncbi:MAG: transcriptional repressor [Alkaliphilus sp.]|nr:transcriptional repressor [Alkaliphilus sp.]